MLAARPSPLFSRSFPLPAAWLVLWLLGWALLTRFSALGDGAYLDDEAFYFLSGLRLHDGAVPYADLWDRKGPGLFAIAWALAGLSRDFLVFQLAGFAAAMATAWFAALIAHRLFGPLAAFFSGAAYLVFLPYFGGGSAQSPVFYSLPMAAAAWLVLGEEATLRSGHVGAPALAAMLLAGSAITFKQTAFFEAAFLGCTCLWFLRDAGLNGSAFTGKALLLALAGIAPSATFALAFAAGGHFADYWQAMVGSNLARVYYPPVETATRAGKFALFCLPALVLAAGGLLGMDTRAVRYRPFLLAWLVAGVMGVVSVPNFYQHYALPLMLPISVCAGGLMQRGRMWQAMGGVLLLIVLVNGPALAFAERARARTAMDDITAAMQDRVAHPRLFVFEGPVDLYRRVGSVPPTRLLFPMHLFHVSEEGTSPFDTAAETRRVLDWQPDFVVTYADDHAHEENPRTAAQVQAYLRRCPKLMERAVDEVFSPHRVAVYGPCAAVR